MLVCISDALWRAFKYMFLILACPTGHYGLHCEQICKCKNNGDCNPASGDCQCPPGWKGDDCSIRKFQ